MKVIAVIPARYSSTRFPGKALALLNGKPIIQHVYEATVNSGLFDQVIIATDDDRISHAVHDFHGRCCMTSPDHKSGSDRIAEVVRDMDCDVVFNVQGDEPFISREPLSALKDAFLDKTVEVASLMHIMQDEDDIVNPNNVKVVCDSLGDALFFSRSVIPYDRDNTGKVTYWKHIGVYAYRKQTLLRFITLPQGKIERIESLEQLRMLENGIRIRMIKTDYMGIGIDTPEDLEKAKQF
ncbi:MAG TPA: 3-deoxy-manno-octulosonate cytidylyltransferase [Candidatus Cloacimonadota bacterium]|nr:3-deoxy-manno-octulosonate cytidylyltransferase [Candidatus Cloacimonadota bacterium]HPT70959.1 3-deoxy-manno-octulosonate cytidylyltransferase [Candidatus Cloacimonadota bacterium]